jgi:copper chaperone CopZ
MERATIEIEGMSCGNCVQHVTRALGSLAGVKIEAVEIGKAVVTFDPAVIEPSVIERAVTEEGYPAHFVMAS